MTPAQLLARVREEWDALQGMEDPTERMERVARFFGWLEGRLEAKLVAVPQRPVTPGFGRQIDEDRAERQREREDPDFEVKDPRVPAAILQAPAEGHTATQLRMMGIPPSEPAGGPVDIGCEARVTRDLAPRPFRVSQDEDFIRLNRDAIAALARFAGLRPVSINDEDAVARAVLDEARDRAHAAEERAAKALRERDAALKRLCEIRDLTLANAAKDCAVCEQTWHMAATGADPHHRAHAAAQPEAAETRPEEARQP